MRCRKGAGVSAVTDLLHTAVDTTPNLIPCFEVAVADGLLRRTRARKTGIVRRLGGLVGRGIL
jgi:hypothetical protein